MQHDLHVYYSNRVEQLFEAFKETLYALPSTPFTRRLVIVPSAAIKSWIVMNLARDPQIKIAAGLEFCYIDPSVQLLKGMMEGERISKVKLPNGVELALAIEWSLKEMIASLPPAKIPSWQPLLSYLNVQPGKPVWKTKSVRRSTSLAHTLAQLFRDYGKYGGELIKEWEEADQNQIGWQQQLWKYIFRPGSPWTYLYRELKKIEGDQEPIPDVMVHLFSVSFLPRLYFDFFNECSKRLPIKHYLLSPSQQFWSDLPSQKEAFRLLKRAASDGVSQLQQNDLEVFLSESHPLLGNLGKLARKMAIQVEESLAQTFENYVMPQALLKHGIYEPLLHPDTFIDETATPLSLLQAVQADMQLMRYPSSSAQPTFSTFDQSIQVHAVPNRLREAEVLYDLLMGLIHKHSEDPEPLTPRDIVVMAPDITEYEPFLKMVFSDNESGLDVQIMDLSLSSQNLLIQGYLHLLALPRSRWDATSLLALFHHPAFQKKHRFSVEEVNLLETWIKECPITWGQSESHRNAILQAEHCRKTLEEDAGIGTWEQGLRRLIAGLILAGEETEGPILPFEGIDFSQGEFLGKAVRVLESLHGDLQSLIQNSLTLQEWVLKLQGLLETYFDTSIDKGEGAKDLDDVFGILREAAQTLTEASFDFDSIFQKVKESLSTVHATYHETHLCAVRFCSLLPMRTIPAKVIVLMGMQEGSYPRISPKLALDLLAGRPKADYAPSQVDFDRHLFLEALLSARQYFLMSYVTLSEEDYKEQSPSLLVSELLNYMDRAYRVAKENVSTLCYTKHPYHAFDSSYFQETSQCRSYSLRNYKNALAFYNPEKRPPFCLIPSFDVSRPKKRLEKLRINLRDLIAFARNPLKTYLNSSLGIYLEEAEQRVVSTAERFQLSSLDQGSIKKKSLKKPLEQLLKYTQKVGKLPFGMLREIAVDRLTEDVRELHAKITRTGADIDALFEVEFSDLYSIPVKMPDGKWQLPPLIIPHEDYGEIMLVGKLTEVSNQGLIVYHHAKEVDIVKSLPQFLTFHSLIKAYDLPLKPQLIFAKDGKIGIPFDDDPLSRLNNYLSYYLLGLENASPLVPEFAHHLMDQDVLQAQAKLEKVLTDQHPKSKINNQYIEWTFRESLCPNVKNIQMHWHALADQLFSQPYAAWTQTKREKEKDE